MISKNSQLKNFHNEILTPTEFALSFEDLANLITGSSSSELLWNRNIPSDINFIS